MNAPIITIAHAAPSERLLAIENDIERVARALLDEKLPDLIGADRVVEQMEAIAFGLRRLRTYLTSETCRVQIMEQAQRVPSRRERAVRVGFSG